MLDPHFHLHYHPKNKQNSALPVELVFGTGRGHTKEVNGNVHVKPVYGRPTLQLSGAGAMLINGSLIIG